MICTVLVLPGAKKSSRFRRVISRRRFFQSSIFLNTSSLRRSWSRSPPDGLFPVSDATVPKSPPELSSGRLQEPHRYFPSVLEGSETRFFFPQFGHWMIKARQILHCGMIGACQASGKRKWRNPCEGSIPTPGQRVQATEFFAPRSPG